MHFYLLWGQDMVFISTEYGGRELLLHNYHPGCISLNKGKRKAKGQA